MMIVSTIDTWFCCDINTELIITQVPVYALGGALSIRNNLWILCYIIWQFATTPITTEANVEVKKLKNSFREAIYF